MSMLLRTLSIVAALAWIGAVLAMFHARVHGHRHSTRRSRAWERLAYGVLLIALAVLAVTGFGSVLAKGNGNISGLALWLHFLAAPIFISGLLLIVLAWAERSRFDADPSNGFSHSARVWFWVVAFSGFGTMASILLSMTPFFSSEAQYTLVAIHRYGALALVFAAAMQAWALLPVHPTQPAPPPSAFPSSSQEVTV